MIQSLKIQNFQSHKDTQLDFSPGVNVIVGDTDSGKTAIIRALRWLVWNRPGGDAFRSRWGGDTRVALEIEKQIITRAKSKKNLYETANKGAEIIEGGLILEAFGTGVPEEIQKSLNIDETNLQMQLDAPFLISKSPGEVSTYFNKIAHLDQIDTSLKAINKEYHTLNSKKGHDETQVEELQVDLASFDYLEKFEIELEVLEERQSQRKQYWASVQNLKTVIKEIEEIDAGIAKKQLTIAFEKSVNKLLAMWTEADKKVKEASELEDTLKELSDIENETVELKRKVKLLPQVVRLLVMWDKERSLAKEIREFRRTGREIKEVNSAIEKIDKKIEKLETKFHKLMPEICPLCGK